MALPRNEYGDIITSAEFGVSYMVRIEWSTDEFGAPIDVTRESPAETFHGPFDSLEEATEWLEAYPDDTDVFEMTAITLNNVRNKEN